MCVQVLEPVTTGASIYEESEHITPVLTTDIRLGPRPDSHSGQVEGKIELGPGGANAWEGKRCCRAKTEV